MVYALGTLLYVLLDWTTSRGARSRILPPALVKAIVDTEPATIVRHRDLQPGRWETVTANATRRNRHTRQAGAACLRG